MTKAQLEALIQREAEEYADGFFARHESASWLSEKIAYKAGASILLPALIEALEALEKIKNHEFKDAIMSDIAEQTSRRIKELLGDRRDSLSCHNPASADLKGIMQNAIQLKKDSY